MDTLERALTYSLQTHSLLPERPENAAIVEGVYEAFTD
jgi:hypothetical protein